MTARAAESGRTARTAAGEPLDADRRRALSLVPVSRETGERLVTFVDLLARWRGTTNLIAESSFPIVWTRHIADSAQLPPLVPGAVRWLDMGSGAGFPGLIVAILLAGTQGAIVHCVDSDRRRCAFLREAARATGAPAIVHPARVEALDPDALGPVDCVTARAFAPLPRTLEFARPWLMRGAIGLFPRGRSAVRDLGQDPPPPDISVEPVRSLIDPEAAILRVRLNAKPTP